MKNVLLICLLIALGILTSLWFLHTENSNNDLLDFGVVPDEGVYRVYEKDIDYNKIPFYLQTNLNEDQLSNYSICYTILLDDNERASETDCIELLENISYDMEISLEELNLAPSDFENPYGVEGSDRVQIVVGLVQNDRKEVRVITGDSSANLDLLENEALVLKTSGVFTAKGVW